MGTFCNNSPGAITSSGDSLHFEFYSDSSINESGWLADINCGAPIIDICDAVASGNLDTDGDGISDVCDEDNDGDGIPDVLDCPAPNVVADPVPDAVTWTDGDFQIYAVGGNTNGLGYQESGFEQAVMTQLNYNVLPVEGDFIDAGDFATFTAGGGGSISVDTSGGVNPVGLSVVSTDSFISGSLGDGIRIEATENNTAGEFYEVNINFNDPVTAFSFDWNDIFDADFNNVDARYEIYADGVLLAFFASPWLNSNQTGFVPLFNASGTQMGNFFTGQNLEAAIGFITSDPVSTITLRYNLLDDTFNTDWHGLDSFIFLSTAVCDPASISGTIYHDINADASINGTDVGLGSITVTLADSNGNTIMTTTLPDGSYLFDTLPPGDYTIAVDTTSFPTGPNVPDPPQTEDPDEMGVCMVCDSITTMPIILTSDQDITDVDFGYTGNTLPVTLSHISSKRVGNKVAFDWGTSSELFNVGFQLWGLDGADGQWHKLHNWLVKSGSGNAVEPQSYRKRVRIPRAIEQLVSIGISSVDSDGTEHYYGPFELGVSYGELGDLAPIAWDQVRAELDARMAAQGYTKSGVNGYRKASSPSALGLSGSGGESVIEFSVSTAGVYRISGSELPEVWHSAPKGELALLDYQGHAVVRHVQAKGEGRGRSKALGAAGSIYFYSRGMNETERLYSEAKVYRLVLDSARVLNAPLQRRQRLSGGYSASYREVSVVEEDEYYIFHSEVDDPWLDEVVIGYSDKLRVRRQPVPVEADLVVEDSATLLLNLGRSSALGAVDLDGDGIQDAEHIVTGTVTSADGVKVKLDPVSAVGSGGWDLALPIPQGTLLGDANGIVKSGAFFDAGEGYAFSEVHIDSIGLEYSRPYVAKAGDDHLFFSAPDTGELGYSVRVPDLGDKPWVFASDGSNLVRIVLESQRKVSDSEGVKWREVTFSRLLGRELSELPIHYWVSGRNGFYGVEGLVEKVVPSQGDLLAQAQGSDYVIVSHPMFMGTTTTGIDHLSGYADFKRSQGYTVSMINYLDIVESFGGGQVGPWGLTHYLSELKRQSPILKYLLLVGSSVYDHSDKLGTGALTFIPGHYVPGSHSNFTVSNVPYITDGDGDLVAHIGRWPVREISELQVIVAKSMQWGTQDHSSGEALLIAEHTVGGEEIDFAQALDGVAQVLPDTYSQTKVYVDAILENDPDLTLTQALALAKGEIIDELNNGPEVVVYNGHASTGQLSNQNLFKHSDVSQVTSSGAEIWVPLSCYVTYYESTTVNTLAHQLLFTGNAVTITGAMLLSNQGENIQMGEAILDRTLNQGQSIGEAVTQAKTIQNNPNLTNNWAILGDPSSVLMTQ